LAEIIECALAKQPEQRWKSAMAMRTAISHVV
jgi:hypothetical protein